MPKSNSDHVLSGVLDRLTSFTLSFIWDCIVRPEESQPKLKPTCEKLLTHNMLNCLATIWHHALKSIVSCAVGRDNFVAECKKHSV
jgi:hypothetical protein